MTEWLGSRTDTPRTAFGVSGSACFSPFRTILPLALLSCVVAPIHAQENATRKPPAAATEASEGADEQGTAPDGAEQKANIANVDGKGDLSRWLLDGRGFLPVPIVITDPTLGSGGGLGAVRFRRPSASGNDSSSGVSVQPHMFGIAGFRTSNGSKGAGAGAMLRLKDDTWRYLGLLADVSLNLEYRAAMAARPGPSEIDYNIDGLVSFQSLRYGLNENTYLGLNWIYTDIDISFEIDSDRDLFKKHELSRTSSGLGLSLEYDTRDTMLTPSRGWLGSVESMWYDAAIGSDSNFQIYRTKAYAYAPFGERFVLAGRFDLQLAQGDVPFYRLPYIQLRGIGAARYQDTRALVLETELRWNATHRIALVGFTGAGRTWGRHGDFGDADDRISKGLGARYKLSESMGLYVGLDYAWGPEDGVYYVQIGSAWR